MFHRTFLRSSSARSAVAAFLLASGAAYAQNAYVQTNLVSDLSGVAAATDANLVNPWGISASAGSPLWVANNGTGTSTIYDGLGNPQSLVVTIPPPAGGAGPAAPTGTVFNSTSSFAVGPSAPALFLFATEDGTISGWNPGVNSTNAILKVDNSASGAVYKGLALVVTGSGPMLYATNFHSGMVEVYDGSFNPVNPPGGFFDWSVPRGYAPFGIQPTPDNNLIVTYALQDAAKHDDVAGSGHGYVDEFDTNGNLLRRLAAGGALDSPWGIAFAPATGFGQFSGALLIGNFGDGRINAYTLPNPMSDRDGDFFFGFFQFFGNEARFLDSLRDPNGHPITNLGLWGIRFGNGAAKGGAVNSLYFTAGIPGSVGTLTTLENHGLFGVLNVQPPTP
jgi:uncharacterized protein (TIGR03118 family)